MTEHKEDYYPHYDGFKFHSKKAQYAYLRSLWPHHQHQILAYMHFKNLMGYDPYVTIMEIADELEIHKARASQDLDKMAKRKHLKPMKKERPYRYYITDQGGIYASNVWDNFQKYNLNLINYFIKVKNLPDLKLVTNVSYEDFMESHYNSECRRLLKEFARVGIELTFKKKLKQIDDMNFEITNGMSKKEIEKIIDQYIP